MRQIYERIAQRRKFPVQHGDDAWLNRVEHDITQAIVAMNDGRFLRLRQVVL